MYRIIATDGQGNNCTTAEILGEAYGRLYVSPTAAHDAIEAIKDALVEAGVTEDIDCHPLADDSLVEAVHDYLSTVELPDGITLGHEWAGDADGAVEAVIVTLRSAGGVQWDDDVEDAIDLGALGLRFADSGGLGGPHIVGGVTYDGGTYQRWAL